jgi:hypothetical protein
MNNTELIVSALQEPRVSVATEIASPILDICSAIPSEIASYDLMPTAGTPGNIVTEAIEKVAQIRELPQIPAISIDSKVPADIPVFSESTKGFVRTFIHWLGNLPTWQLVILVLVTLVTVYLLYSIGNNSSVPRAINPRLKLREMELMKSYKGVNVGSKDIWYKKCTLNIMEICIRQTWTAR